MKFNDKNIEKSGFKFLLNLREYQIDITNKCIDYTIKYGGGVLSVPPGRGKTIMALYMAAKFGLKTLVIVHKTFLQDQWIERAKQFTDAKIGTIRQNIVDVEGCDIVIGMLQSLSMRDYDNDIFNKFGFVIVDETHHIASKVFSRALFKTGAKYTLGLSATPIRADGLSYVLDWFLGKIMYREETHINTQVVVKKLNYRSDDKLFTEQKSWVNGKMRPSFVKMISNLIELTERDEHILDVIKCMIDQNSLRKVLILSGRIKHLEYLKNNIDEYIKKQTLNGSLCEDEIKTSFYIGSLSQAQRKTAEADADIIFASYGMAEEGLDIDRLNTIILATPKKNVEQAVGRIMRKILNGAGLKPLIIDFSDALSIFISQGMARHKLYKKGKYKIDEYYIKNNNLVSKSQYNEETTAETINSNNGTKMSDIILDIDNDDYVYDVVPKKSIIADVISNDVTSNDVIQTSLKLNEMYDSDDSDEVLCYSMPKKVTKKVTKKSIKPKSA
jgi:superfamily II DNA or RNA helicase